MSPYNGNNTYGIWAACGEIDIVTSECNLDPAYYELFYGGRFPKIGVVSLRWKKLLSFKYKD